MAEETDEQRRARWAAQNKAAKEDWEQTQADQRNMQRMKQGRFPMLTPQIENELLSRLGEGETITKICSSDYMPAVGTVYVWLREDSEFAARFREAREAGAHAMAAHIQDIADEVPDAVFDEYGNKKFDPGYIQWQKNRMDARKFITAKVLPKVYGDRYGIEGVKDGDPIKTEGEVDISYERMMAVMENLEMSKRLQGRDTIKTKDKQEELEPDQQEDE